MLTSSTSHPSLQERICQQIFALPPNCPRAQVHTALDPLLEVDFSDTEDDIQRMFHDKDIIEKSFSDEHTISSEFTSNTPPENITPLMVACDKGNQACLDYIYEKHLSVEKTKDPVRLRRAKTRKFRSLLGNPLVDASVQNHNTAMHHAATAGCWTAIKTLHQIQKLLLMQDESHERGEREHTENMGTAKNPLDALDSIFLRLGSVRNAHNDTPLMMATQSSHSHKFVKTWYELTWKEQQAINTDNPQLAEMIIRNVLEAQNDSNDTCLSLACSHGQIDLVRFLVGMDDTQEEGGNACANSRVNVTTEEVSKCQSSLQRMEQALKSNPSLKEEYQRQCDNVKASLGLLESYLAHVSEQATLELLQEEEFENNDTSSGSSYASKAKRKIKKKNAFKGKKTMPSSSKPLEGAEKSNTDAAKSINAEEQGATLTTLPDGKLAVRVKGHEDPLPSAKAMLGPIPRSEASGASEMFRERFKGISSEVDSVMSALCLDVKCLLYSDHGMALNLSPAQLDSVQQILEKQLMSVQKAREIQQRMHETGGSREFNQI
jgi:ankyrin repeat protein